MIRALSAAGLSPLDKAVLKASWDDKEPPKPKHVTTILGFLQDMESNKKVFSALIRRIKKCSGWSEMLKTLLLIHLMTQIPGDGGKTFLSELVTSPSIYSLVEDFEDKTNESTLAYSKFTREYAKYLSCKVQTFLRTGRCIERDPPFCDAKWPASLNKHRLVRSAGALQEQMAQLQTLLQCTKGYSTIEISGQAIVIQCIDIFLKEMLRLWNCLQHFFLELGKSDDMSGKDLELCLQIGSKMMEKVEFDAAVAKYLEMASESMQKRLEPKCASTLNHASDLTQKWTLLVEKTKTDSKLVIKLALGEHAGRPPPGKAASVRLHSPRGHSRQRSAHLCLPGKSSAPEPQSCTARGHRRSKSQALKSHISEKFIPEDEDAVPSPFSPSMFSNLSINTVEDPTKPGPSAPKSVGGTPNRMHFSFE